MGKRQPQSSLAEQLNDKFVELETAKQIHRDLYIDAEDAATTVRNLEYEVQALARQLLDEQLGNIADRITISVKQNY